MPWATEAPNFWLARPRRGRGDGANTRKAVNPLRGHGSYGASERHH
jgi:hypothetical protein